MTSTPGLPQALETPPTESTDPISEARQRRIIAVAVLVGLVLIAAIVVAVAFLIGNPTRTETIRDIFIIFMAVESLVIGLALIVLIVQLARLTNLLQHEIRPILNSTNETVNTLRGTTVFISENLVDPVMKLNGYLAAIMQVVNIIKPGRGGR